MTLPGFGGSAAPPMPEEGTSYAEQTWTRGAQDAVARLIEDEGLDRPVVVGHWVSATQVVLGLALERPDLLRGAIVISGVPKFVPTGSGMPELTTQQQRAMMVDHSFAPQWFRTVTRETWDDNNYLPGDYAIHPLRGLQLWKQAAEPPLPVWVRYLCEYWAYDATSELERLAVPVLILQPEFDSLYSRGPQRGNYMETFLHTAWEGVPERSELLTLRKIADSRVFIMDDQPEALNAAVREFVDGPAALAPAVARPDPAPRATAPAVARRDLWNGRIERSGNRYVLADSAVSLERPDSSWELEPVADEPPIVARMSDGGDTGQMTIQIQPVFGMALDTLVPMIDSRIAAKYSDFERLSTERTLIDGHDAYRVECRYVKEDGPEQASLVFTKLDDNHLLSFVYLAAPDDFDRLRSDFEAIERSIRLE